MIVIIGHGESPLGKGWGPEIDRHEVVRLKNWQDWQNPADYGSRLDYWCCSTETMGHFRPGAREYWAQPKKGTWNGALEMLVRSQVAPLTIELELFKRWNDVFHEFQPEIRNYSVGMFAIIKAATKGQDVALVGFDNLLNPEQEYRKALRGKWPTGHDWRAEKAMLPLVEKEYGVSVGAFR